MNAFGRTPDPERGDDEPPIIFICVDKKTYYLFKGDEFLNQVLLADGEFPKPILCVNFDNIFDLRAMLGADFSLSACWAIHPEIVARLRNENALIEASG
ncbi:MAG: hypothetical protein AB3N17_07310 [Tateyamaria sp.]